MPDHASLIRQLLSQAPVVPVIAIHDLDSAIPLAMALRDGGLPVLEITLRTPHGLPAIRRIKEELEGVIVGAGTVTNLCGLDEAIKAGSEFIITPGTTPRLLSEGCQSPVPFLPGISSASELMVCAEAGLKVLKFFPAESSGGAKSLKAFGGPFPDISFCPTGGIGLHNIADYLAVPSVLSVGGSWLTPDDMVREGNWTAITALAREACLRVAAIREGQHK